MSQRVLIGLEAGAEWSHLRGKLVSMGADSVKEPAAGQPDLIVATVPDGAKADEFLRLAKRLPGVRYAELDAWRFSST